VRDWHIIGPLIDELGGRWEFGPYRYRYERYNCHKRSFTWNSADVETSVHLSNPFTGTAAAAFVSFPSVLARTDYAPHDSGLIEAMRRAMYRVWFTPKLVEHIYLNMQLMREGDVDIKI
jgi:hypothetical protein